MKKVLVLLFVLTFSYAVKAQSNKPLFSMPFKLFDNRPFIEVKIKNRTFHFMLDCGAGNAMDVATADSLRLELTHPTLQNGAGAKRVTFWMTQVDTLTIGPEKLPHVTLQVTDFSEIRNKLRLPYLDGVIGYNFMKNYAVQFDYLHGTLNFYKSYSGIDGLPFSLYYAQIPKIQVQIDGNPATVIVDTGDRSALTIFSHYADKISITTNYKVSAPYITGYGIGGAITARTFSLKELKIGGKSVKSVVSRIPTLTTGGFAATDIDGSIGGGVLRNYKVTIDYLGRKIYLD